MERTLNLTMHQRRPGFELRSKHAHIKPLIVIRVPYEEPFNYDLHEVLSEEVEGIYTQPSIADEVRHHLTNIYFKDYLFFIVVEFDRTTISVEYPDQHNINHNLPAIDQKALNDLIGMKRGVQ